MMNIKVFRTVLLLIILFITSANKCQENTISVDEIWNSYLNEIGDKNSINAIKTLFQISEMETKYGVIKTKTKIRFPNKMYREIEMPNRNTIHILNGKKGKTIINNQINDMSEIDLSVFSEVSQIFPEFYYKTTDNSIKFLKQKHINNNSYYLLQVKAENETSTYWIDKKTYRLFKKVTDEYEYEIIETQRINNVLSVFSAKMIIRGDTLRIKNIETKYNLKFNDSIFNINHY